MMIAGELKVFRPGDIYEGEKEALGRALDQWEQLDPDPLPPLPPEPTRPLKVVHRGFGKWDVINQETGTAINDQPLSKEEALAMVGEAED